MLSGINEEIALPLLTERPIIKPDTITHSSIHGKRVMVTGAGGSIGSELCLQIVASQPASLTMVDHSELNLYEVNCTIANSDLRLRTMAAIADVRDLATLRSLFMQVQPEIVFHAAALKHVPLLENDHNIVEAVRTNVLGTKHVADLCCAYGASMIFVSTDKAVNPSSGMGLTKRVAEIYLQGKAQRHPETRMAQVRFGNVFGSSGSVVPLFRRQIAHGGPVTVTDTEMTRYIMTIKEAVGLTLCAANLNVQGGGYGIYVLDMGQPIKIIDLARQLIEQSGLRPGVDIEIKIIGMRAGEKLHEEMSYAWEALKRTRVPRVMKANTTFDPRKTLNSVDLLLGAAERRDARAVKDALLLVVPEYVGEVTF